MIKQALWIGAVSSLLAAAGGCGVVHALFCDPFGNGGCRRAPCDGCCDDGACCASACRGVPCAGPGPGARCGPACGGECCEGGCPPPGCCRVGPVCEPDCGCCDGDCTGPGVYHCCSPIRWFFGLFHPINYPNCGCGERYWGEWINDPPACHDPCDCHGNFVPHGPPPAAGVPTPAPPTTSQWRPRENSDVVRAPHALPSRSYAASEPLQSYAASGSSRSYAPSSSSRSYAASGYSRSYAPAGSSSPRIISETDRVVGPAEEQAAYETAQPVQRAAARY
jgi:hypothetical protein